MTKPDRSNISKLLTALWEEQDQDIQCFLERNDESHDYYVDFYCMRSLRTPCENCRAKGFINGCNHLDRRVCFCAEELEFLPLAVHDKEQLRRMCINVYVGACPHVICLIEERIELLNDAFLLNKMEHSYSTVDMMHKSTLVKSFDRVQRDTKDVVIRAGAYTEHFLLRLGKIRFLTRLLCNYILDKKGIRLTFCHSYNVLHLSILHKKTEFLLAMLKRKSMSKPRNLHNTFMSRSGKLENTILYMAMEKDSVNEFMQIVKMMKRERKRFVYVTYQLPIKTTLWRSIAKSKVDFVKILLQSNLLQFNYRHEIIADDNRTLSFSSMVRNNHIEILDLLMDYPGFNTYLAELLPLAVMYGNVRMCEKLLKRFSKYYNIECRRDVDVYTMAVLQNYPEVLNVLLRYKVPPLQHYKFTALDFAKSFRREKCCDSLRRNNHECHEFITDISPLLEVQKLDNGSCFRILSFVNLVEELIHKGFNVNFEDENGITPVQLAIKRWDYDTVRMLLMNGADPFRGQSFILQYGTMRLVTELFHCNVDICNHLSRLLQIARRCTAFPRQLTGSTRETDRAKLAYSFILDSLHSLSARDRRHLGWYYEEYDFHLELRSLKELCRMTLRRHYGRHIHRYVSVVIIPESLKRFLLLSDIIDLFKTMIIL